MPYDDHDFFQVNSAKIINFSITPEERSEGMHALGGYLYKRIPTLRLATTTDQLNFKNDVSIYGVFQLPVTWD